jgi:hypothetical protein
MFKPVALIESAFDTQILTEADAEGNKNWFIEGVFVQSDVVNKNRRIYPRPIMEKEINSYINEYVLSNRAVGELSHPEGTEINLDKITHIIESIEQHGNNFHGKAKILNTPSGNIVKGLLEGGVKLGVSSRARGSVKTNRDGINEVQSDFRLAAVDIVYQPSAPDAFVNGLMENSPFLGTICEDVEFMESLKSDIRNTKSKDLQEAKLEAFSKFMRLINGK